MTGTLTELFVAMAVFAATHSGPARTATRAKLTGVLGERGYIALYSLVSLVVTAWMVVAALRAPYVELWPMTPAAMWVPVLTMPLACLFLLWGLTTPNPLSVPVRARAYDPSRPGALAVTRHPVLWGLGLWAASHVPPNGDVARAVLFGLGALFALGGTFMLDARRRKAMGEAEWKRLSAGTSLGFHGLAWTLLLDWRLPAALVLYGSLMHFHLPVIGVSPLPPMG